MGVEKAVMVEIEGKLKNDVNGVFKKETMDYLSEQLQGVRRKIDSGLSNDEYAKYNTFKDAIVSSMTILDKTYNVLHRR
ncbi:MAG: hypothetical protein HQL01_09780 [Nitrospirae bacterium]|nr:hypothetical protein [Nitrospirota bacterium]